MSSFDSRASLDQTAIALMRQWERPFYLYDECSIARQAALLRESFPQFSFLYSIKANPFRPVVESVLSQGLGADAASIEEVKLAAALGTAKGDLYYSAPGKTRGELAEAAALSTCIADSCHELLLLNEIALERETIIECGIRINPDFTMAEGRGASSKFGIDIEALEGLIPVLRSLSNITVKGIHVHLKSQILDEGRLFLYYSNVLKMAHSLGKRMGWNLQFINFGGGLGIPYAADTDRAINLPQLGMRCTELLQSLGGMEHVRLLIETGRFVVCEAGTYLTPIVDVKESRGMKYLIVQNGINGFFRPAIAELISRTLSGSYIEDFSAEPLFTADGAFAVRVIHTDEVASKNEEKSNEELVSVVGNLCTSADILSSQIMLPRAEIGDLISVSHAGSYGYALSPLQFSSHKAPLQALRRQDGIIITE